MAGIRDPAGLVQEQGIHRKEAAELAAVGDVRQRVEQKARVGGREVDAVAVGEQSPALGGEVNERQQAGEVGRSRVLASAEIGLVVDSAGNRRAPGGPAEVAPEHLRVQEPERAHERVHSGPAAARRAADQRFERVGGLVRRVDQHLAEQVVHR